MQTEFFGAKRPSCFYQFILLENEYNFQLFRDERATKTEGNERLNKAKQVYPDRETLARDLRSVSSQQCSILPMQLREIP